MFALLAGERLDDPHAGDVLGERRGDEAEPLAHRRGRRASSSVRKKNRRDAHHRDHRQRGEREPPVEDEEQDRGADQRQRVLDEARDAVGDELVERLDVVRQPADDHAGPIPLVEAEREPLEVVEELRPQVGEHPLADPARQVRLRVAHAPVREPGEEEARDDRGRACRRSSPFDRVVERRTWRAAAARARSPSPASSESTREDRPPRYGRQPGSVAKRRRVSSRTSPTGPALLEQMAPGLAGPSGRSRPPYPHPGWGASRRPRRDVTGQRTGLRRSAPIADLTMLPSDLSIAARLDRVGELALEQPVLVDLAVHGARREQLLVRAARGDAAVRRGRRSRPRARSSRGGAR